MDFIFFSGVLHKGYLKVPDASSNGRTWKTVGVQISKDRLIVDGGKKINLNPDSGFVYIQSTVAYSELLHTSAYDQPHIFKIGYSSGSNLKDVYYFMAKTFQEKGAWIDAIEKVTLTLSNESDPLPVHSPSKLLSPSKALVKWNHLTSFPDRPEIHLYCALEMTGNDVIFGTSSGIYRTSGCGDDATWLPSSGEECVFQMALVEDMNEVIGIVGAERKLVVMKEDDLERAFRYFKSFSCC